VTKILSAGQNADVDRILTKPLGRQRLDLAAARVDRFVCLSEQVEHELRTHGVPDGRMVRIANGVDLAHFRPATTESRRAERRRLGIPGEEPLVVYCGRFAEIKRVDALLQAAAGAPVHVLMVGEGPEEDALRSMAGQPSLAGRVTIMPTVRDTAPVLRAADMYASASITEGMSGAVLEAMASGLPVVASRASGMDELLGRTTGMAKDDSVEALRDVLAGAAADEEWRRTEGHRLRRRAEEHFGLDTTADRLVALYRQLAERPPS
jgi:glycosyltransferase involved in cell wall biosynthesis